MKVIWLSRVLLCKSECCSLFIKLFSLQELSKCKHLRRGFKRRLNFCTQIWRRRRRCRGLKGLTFNPILYFLPEVVGSLKIISFPYFHVIYLNITNSFKGFRRLPKIGRGELMLTTLVKAHIWRNFFLRGKYILQFGQMLPKRELRC